MQFPDSSVPIATCDASGCEGCRAAESVQCHFGPGDLIHFYLISLPVFLVGGAGILAVGMVPLLIWIGVLVAFFGFIEIRVMCSHCPHYAEEGSTLRCWANYGSPTLWKYRPGPMSTAENRVRIPSRFLGGRRTVVPPCPLPPPRHRFRRVPEEVSLLQMHELRVSAERSAGAGPPALLGAEPQGRRSMGRRACG